MPTDDAYMLDKFELTNDNKYIPLSANNSIEQIVMKYYGNVYNKYIIGRLIYQTEKHLAYNNIPRDNPKEIEVAAEMYMNDCDSTIREYFITLCHLYKLTLQDMAKFSDANIIDILHAILKK